MTIKVSETLFDTIYLYKKANSIAQRALAGYIVKTGATKDPILCGAFNALRQIERANNTGEIYELLPYCEREVYKKIIYICQISLDGKLDQFAFSERDCKDNIKFITGGCL